jgi:hypothetical protein
MPSLTDGWRPTSGRAEAGRLAIGGSVTGLPLVVRGPGRSFEARLLVEPRRGTTTQAIEYRLPHGGSATDISDGGVYDTSTNTVKWGPFFDDVSRIVTCRVTLPPGARRGDAYRGLGSFDGAAVPIRRQRRATEPGR